VHLPACRCVPTAGNVGGRSGTADTSPASPATVLRFPAPRTPRSALRAYRATAGRDCPHAEAGAIPAPPLPIVHRSVPNDQSLALRGYLRATTESHEIGSQLFMRLVLLSCGKDAPHLCCPPLAATRRLDSPLIQWRGNLTQIYLLLIRKTDCRYLVSNLLDEGQQVFVRLLCRSPKRV
jgi:hypothetical protein